MNVNQKELAMILGITDRRLRQLKQDFGLFAEGVATEKTRKNYILEKCVPEYIQYKVNTEVGQGTKKGIEKEKEQAEHERVKKEIAKIKLRRLKGQMHEAKDVEEFLTDMLINFKNTLLAVPGKVAPIVQGEEDINEIVKAIEKEVYEALSQLCEYDPLKIEKDNDMLEEIREEEEEEE